MNTDVIAVCTFCTAVAPIVDPPFSDVRSPTNQPVTLRCAVLKANPPRITRASWLMNGRPLRPEALNTQDAPTLRIERLGAASNGTYECRISNGVGISSCIFNVSTRAYNPEFYYDTPNPISILKDNNYSYILQWTQKEPKAVDRIIGYWINVRQNKRVVFSRQIDVNEPEPGVLMYYTLTDLRIPLSYEVRLTAITMFGVGDPATRAIHYSEHHVCGFEDDRICGFTQDRSDVFDWTRQNHLTQNPKRTANTGPDTDRSGTKEGTGARGYYMYIEASRPRAKGDVARLLSPLYNVTTSRGPSGSSRVPYCISFYYHMKGMHIAENRTHQTLSSSAAQQLGCYFELCDLIRSDGLLATDESSPCIPVLSQSLKLSPGISRLLDQGSLNVLLRMKGIATVDKQVWSCSGNQGPEWRQANVLVTPTGPFQLILLYALQSLQVQGFWHECSQEVEGDGPGQSECENQSP
ncbi:hypothetical protein Z043_108779 [Scleropages formosus]|uniref:MAM domain-containing glycosylphosphatidylinositol anchor protein 1-like n=1 Tax=Scleropages formosus TaxID=113540 RepID=A0A0P7URG6_SCLFO|nr:hypothetical protein Z043_108779 [Scleropages formosus]